MVRDCKRQVKLHSLFFYSFRSTAGGKCGRSLVGKKGQEPNEWLAVEQLETRLFETRAASKLYNAGSTDEVQALKRVSLAVPRGSFCVVTGASGSGKSTLMGLLGAVARPSEGQVLFDGRDLGSCSGMELARLRRRIGWVFQGLSLLSRLAVWENVTYALIPRGVGRSTRRAIAKELLHRVGLGHRIAAAPETLSGGERQRVAVARALAGQPEAVLADEPTSSLDPAARQSIAALFADVWQAGTTLIVASHDAELLKLATLRFELDNGTLRDTLTPACGQASQRE